MTSRALDEFDAALALDRSQAEFFYWRRRAHYVLGNLAEAYDDFYAAAELNPELEGRTATQAALYASLTKLFRNASIILLLTLFTA